MGIFSGHDTRNPASHRNTYAEQNRRTMTPQSPTLPAIFATAVLFVLGSLKEVVSQDDVVSLPAGSDAVLSSPYVDSFSCEGQAYGYFADVQNNCEVFHICYPLTDETGRITEYLKWSFFCGNGTVFDQEALVCNHPEDAFPCEESPSLYGSVQFGQVEDDGLDYY